MRTKEALTLTLSLVAGSLAGQEKFDAVAQGQEVFESMGCIVCHSTTKDDVSLKTGPNLFGLFLTEPREVETVEAASGKKRMVKADKAYFLNSVRKSWDELAVAESGETKGTAYPAIMPMFTVEVIPDADLESIWHYVRTMAEADKAGPATVMLPKPKEVVAKTLLQIPGEVPVTTRARVFRARLTGMSGRALYVGLPNGMSYGFDPRLLSVRRIWSGGFLNLKEERNGRGGKASDLGQGASVFLDKEAVLAPLTTGGDAVDFEFKEPDEGDEAAIEKYLWSDTDFMDQLAAVDAEFLGDRLDAKTGEPSFRFRVGKNFFSETVSLSDDGRIEIVLEGKVAEAQRFKVRGSGLGEVQVEGGELRDGVWSLAAAPQSKRYRLQAKLAGGLVARPKVEREENWAPQPLVIAPTEPGKKPLELPAGYSSLTWKPPVDLYGRGQLFEPTGIMVAKDGTVVVATRTAGVWRIRDGKWSLFAEGTFECLGVWIEDDKGDRIVVAQKPELTRIIDSDGDGRADIFDTVCDDYGFQANYHEYTHGPVRDGAGNYYFSLNLAHSGNARASWRAGGPFMGSMGGYRGWACRVTPEGKFEPFAMGLRSPAGLAADPEGRLWYAENQGEYVGSSKVVPLEQGKFYGHISGLVSLPGMNPDSEELKFEHWTDKIRKGAVWLPHGKLANSPGNPAWDVTGGKFGAYKGQMFIGDQTLSTLLRVVTEKVDGADEGCVIAFGRGLSSGVMRPCFLPDGSLLVGQTGRGWNSTGGRQDALQQIVWDGKTVAADILKVTAAKKGFTIHLTTPVAKGVTEADLAKAFSVTSWFYTNTSKYGSPEHDRREEVVAKAVLSADRSSIGIELGGFGEGDKWLARIYDIVIPESGALFGEGPAWKSLEAYYTLRAIP